VLSRIRHSKFTALGLKIAVTLALLYLVSRVVDMSEIRRQLSALETSRIAFLLLISWIGQLFCAQRWRLFAAAVNIHGSYAKFFKLYFLGMLFNLGLPSVVGGDVVKAYVVSRQAGHPLQSGLASVAQDRAAGLLSLMIYGTAAAVVSQVHWRAIPLWSVYALLWAGVVTAGWFLCKGRTLYASKAGDGLPARVLAEVAAFHDAMATMRLSWKAALQVAAISFVNSGLVLWVFHHVTVAVGRPVDFTGFCALVPLITLATMLPISLAGIGIREWSYIQGLGLLGVSADVALTVALATSALLIAMDLAGVFFLPAAPAGMLSGANAKPGKELRRNAGAHKAAGSLDS
jgi:uncharacterized protein (TIRG00374 family)